MRQEEYGWIRSPYQDPDYFQILTGISDFFVQGYICAEKFSWKSDQSLRRYKPKCGKRAISRNVEESFKKFLGPDFRKILRRTYEKLM